MTKNKNLIKTSKVPKKNLIKLLVYPPSFFII